MSAENVLDEIRQALQGRPGQALVLGVCESLAKRMGQETWVVRAVNIILGFALKDTENRTRRFFSGLGVVIRETAEKVFDGFRKAFTDNGPRRSDGY